MRREESKPSIMEKIFGWLTRKPEVKPEPPKVRPRDPQQRRAQAFIFSRRLNPAEALYRAGARKFLVWNSPNIALTPAVRAVAAVNPGVPVLAGATQLSLARCSINF
jgi:phospholipase/lecithinase/hemolysin